MASSPTLLTPTSQPKSLPVHKPAKAIPAAANAGVSGAGAAVAKFLHRRDFLSLAAVAAVPVWALPAAAEEDEEYVKDTEEVIGKVRATIGLEKTDPNVATAVAELRETSNAWVAKYRREKSLLGRASFRDMYSALNAVSGHYISFGPTAPIPAKRKARILEEMDTAEKALLRGR